MDFPVLSLDSTSDWLQKLGGDSSGLLKEERDAY